MDDRSRILLLNKAEGHGSGRPSACRLTERYQTRPPFPPLRADRGTHLALGLRSSGIHRHRSPQGRPLALLRTSASLLGREPRGVLHRVASVVPEVAEVVPEVAEHPPPPPDHPPAGLSVLARLVAAHPGQPVD